MNEIESPKDAGVLARMLQFILRWGPAVIVMAGIFYASSTPSTRLPEFGIWDLLVKKGGHFLGYALLGFALWRGVGVDHPQKRWWALAAAFLYACSDEFHQWFVPGRNAWWLDVVIDTTGAFAAIFLLGRWNKLRRLLKFGIK